MHLDLSPSKRPAQLKNADTSKPALTAIMSMLDDNARSQLHTELELVHSSLLPTETLLIQSDTFSSARRFTPEDALPPANLPIELILESGTGFFLMAKISSYPVEKPEDVAFQLKSAEMDREEATGWAKWVDEVVSEKWDEALESGTPIYHLIIGSFLPILQEQAQQRPSSPLIPTTTAIPPRDTHATPTQVLFTSHHLLAPSKRRDLHSLSSSLNLRGFAKVGHPGIIYALCPSEEAADEFVREVKSWQWLALRLRVVEAVKAEEYEEKGEAGGKVRGSWEEVEKVGEAVEWLRKRGKEHLLLDIGFGSGGGGK